MAASNDFFVKFDSNAIQWANQLDAQLKPARKAVSDLAAALTALDSKAKGAGPAVSNALAQRAQQDSRRGAGVGGGDQLSADALKKATYDQADAVKELTSNLAGVIDQLRGAAKSIETIPNKVSDSIKRLNNKIGQQGQQTAYNPTTGRIASPAQGGLIRGGAQDQVLGIIRRAAQGGLASSAVGGFGRASAPASIQSVRRSDIDRANFDRVVLAIRAQTRALSSGGIRVSGAPENVVSGPRAASRTAAPAAAAQQREDSPEELNKRANALEARLGPMQDKIRQIVELMTSATGEVDEGAQALLDEMKATEAQIKAEVSKVKAAAAKAERDQTGKSRPEQSAERRKSFADGQASRETITDTEREQREITKRLISSPGASDFQSRLGRDKGAYSVEDLHKMAEAFRQLGIEVQANSKTRKPELASKLQDAATQYGQLYPHGAPQLETRNVNIDRTTKISEATESILGDLNELITQRAVARKVISANRVSGGERPSKEYPDALMSVRGGAREFGAAVLGNEVGTPIARGATPKDVIKAYQTMGPQIANVMGHALEQATTKRDFNPFDSSHRIQVGSTEEEKDRGLAATARLRDIRQATIQIDKVVKQYDELTAAFIENEAFIERATTRLEKGKGKASDPEKLAQATETLRPRLRSQIDAIRDPRFDDPVFRTGYNARNTPQIPFRLSPAERYQENSQAARDKGGTLGDFRLLKESLGEAVAGVRTAIGSKNLTRNIPGLSFNGQNFRPAPGAGFLTDATDKGKKRHNEFQEKLDKATEQLTRAQLGRSKVLLDGTSSGEQVMEAEEKLETAANKFANLLQTLFGRAPDLLSMTGGRSFHPEGDDRQFFSQGTAKNEAYRRSVRESQDALIKTPSATDEQKAEAAQGAVITARQRLAKAEQKRAELVERQVELESKLQTAIPDPEKRQQVVARESQIQTAHSSSELDRDRLDSIRGIFEDPSNFGGLQAVLDKATGAATGQVNVGTPSEETPGHMRGVVNTFGTAISALKEHDAQLTSQIKGLADAEAAGRPTTGREGLEQASARNKGLVAQLEDMAKRYGRDTTLSDARGQAESRRSGLAQEGRELGNSTGTAQIFSNLETLIPQLKAADGEIARLAQDITKAEDKAKKLSTAVEKQGTVSETVAKAVGDANGQLAALRQQARDIKAEGPFRRADKKAAFQAGGADSPEYQQIVERRARLKEVQNQIDAAGGGAGGGRGGRTANGGADGTGGGRSVLAQILAELKSIHGTLTGGRVKVAANVAARADELGQETTTTGKRRQVRGKYASNAELTAAASSTDAEIEAAIESQRRRAERLRPSQFNPVGGTNGDGSRYATGTDVDAAYAERDRKNRDQSQGLNKSEAELREQARAAQDLAQFNRLLTSSTEAEIKVLRELTAAADKATTAIEKEAAAEKVAAQQVRVAGAVNKDLRNENLVASDRRAGTRAVLNNAGPQVQGGELDSIVRSARSHPEFRRVGEGYGEQMAEGTQSGFAKVFGGSQGFFNRVLNTTGTFLVRNFAAGFVFGMTNALQQVAEQAIQTEATFVRVSSALEAGGKELGNIRGDLQGISTDYGVQLNDVYETAAGLAGLFDNADDLAGATRIVAQLQTLSRGALNATEAMGVLASTVSAFERQPGDGPLAKVLPEGVDGLQHVADVLTVVQNTLGTNIETTAEGVSAVAGLAKQMSISFEEAAVFTAQIAKQTNTTGADAGDKFSRILGAAQTGRGRKALTDSLGAPAESALAQNDYGKLFEVLIANYGKLTDAQKRNLSTTLAGQRQQAAFNALVNNGAKTIGILNRAENANGEATEQMDKIMRTLNSRLAKLGTQAQNLASNLVRTGILNFLGGVLVAATQVLDVVNRILTLFNGAADENAFLGMLRKLVTALLGAGLAFKVVGSGVRGFKAAMKNVIPEQTRAQAESGPAAPRRYAYGSTGLGSLGGTERGAGGLSGSGVGRAPISRALAFGADRTVGTALTGTGKGLTALGTRMTATDREVGVFSRQVGRASLALGGLAARAGTGVSTIASGVGSRSLAGGVFERSAVKAETRAADLRTQASSLRAQGTAREAAGNAGSARYHAAANGLEESARAADRTADRSRKLASSLSRVNETGALTDGAMIALAVGIAAVGGSLARHKQIAQDLQEGYDAVYGKDKGKTDSDKVEEYQGRLADDASKTFEEEAKKGIWGKGMDALGARFTNGLSGLFDGQKANMKEFGLDGRPDGKFETYGLTDANERYTKGSDELTKLAQGQGTTGDDIRAQQKKISDEIAKQATKIKNDKDLSDAQKQNALGNLQQVDYNIRQMSEDLAAQADGIGSSMALTADQVAKLTDAASVAASTGGARNFGSGAGGADLTNIYKGLIDDVGATSGERIDTLLKQMFSGTASAADIAVDTSRLAQDSVKQLENQLEAKITAGADPEEIDAIRSQLVGKVQELVQDQQAAIDAIINTGEQIATLFDNEGRDAASNQAFRQAMNRAERYYRSQTADQRANLRAVRAAQDAAAGAAGDIEQSLARRRGNNGDGSFTAPAKAQDKNLRGKDAVHRQQMADQVSTAVEREISRQTRPLRVQQSKQTDPKAKAYYDQLIAQATLGVLQQVNQGLPIPGISPKVAERYGNAAVTQDQIADQQVAVNQAAISANESELENASSAAQRAQDLRAAQLGIASAYADARGDAVAGARIGVQIAKSALQLARTQLADAISMGGTAQQINDAKVAVLSAQAQLISANAAVSSAQQELVQSRFDVSIALADAAGHTVEAAVRTLAAARQALQAAMKKSGGKVTAEVNQARVAAIQAEASLRDAKLQDQLDTIDFNLQMNRTTQASAIAALKNILKTNDLTKAQRRSLLLQIKGYTDELDNSQFNFGNIKLPTPYQMRAYIAAQRDSMKNSIAQQVAVPAASAAVQVQAGQAPQGSTNITNHTTITIPGADIAEVKKVIRDVVGGSSSTITRTNSARRGR